MKKRKMGDLSTEMVVPRANEENFGFAFNDYDFSDRVLRLEIMLNDENIDSESIHIDRSKDSGSCDGAKVVTLHITSAILAAKSPFFYKLFKNGMRESQHKSVVSLRIDASEEAALMDLLNFMYGNKLGATSVTDLVNLLIAADKFEVASCMSYCIEMLLKLPMSLEHALVYLELPSSVLVSEIVKPLIDAAKKDVADRYKNFTKCQDDAMKLPLCAIEVVLESKGLQVTSEDDVYDFIVEWAREHYPELEERREIFTKSLARLIYFPNMSSSKLNEVLVCTDFDHEFVVKLVLEALFSKVEHSCGQHIRCMKDLATTNCNLLGRAYWPSCVVYFDIKKDELKSLPPSNGGSLSRSKGIFSHTFCVGGKQLFLYSHRCQEDDDMVLSVCKAQDMKTFTIDLELAVMNKSLKEFQIHYKGKNLPLVGDEGGWVVSNLFGIPWTEFMSDDSDYFINGIFRVRAEITLVKNSHPEDMYL